MGVDAEKQRVYNGGGGVFGMLCSGRISVKRWRDSISGYVIIKWSGYSFYDLSMFGCVPLCNKSISLCNKVGYSESYCGIEYHLAIFRHYLFSLWNGLLHCDIVGFTSSLNQSGGGVNHWCHCVYVHFGGVLAVVIWCVGMVIALLWGVRLDRFGRVHRWLTDGSIKRDRKQVL